MGFFRGVGKFAVGTAKVTGRLTVLTGKAAVLTAKGAGKVLHETSAFVDRHQDGIAKGTQAVVSGVGVVVKLTGTALTKASSASSDSLHEVGSNATSGTGRFLAHAAGYAADGLSLVGKGTAKAGAGTQRAAPAIGGMLGGAMAGSVQTISGAVDSIAITSGDIEKLRNRLRLLGRLASERANRDQVLIDSAMRSRSNKDLLDLLVIGGVSLSEMMRDPSRVPPEVEAAFSAAYPDLARAGVTFSDAVSRLPAEDLFGLVNGVKGKLFEIEFVEHLNTGNLPSGMTAELAASATQPGYDILILDADGVLVEVLSAKATESAAYVLKALERYPDIDVVSTMEVHADLVARGLSEGVSDSGISNAVLQQKVEAAAGLSDGVFDATNLAPSVLGLAVLALSSFMDRAQSMKQRGAQFGSRAAKVSVTGLGAQAALAATGAWWFALAAGVGGGWLATRGAYKREKLESLRAAVGELEKREVRHQLRLTSSPGMLRLT